MELWVLDAIFVVGVISLVVGALDFRRYFRGWCNQSCCRSGSVSTDDTHIACQGGCIDSNPRLPSIDADQIARQRVFSYRTFGPGSRHLGIVDHITRELEEVLADPTDLGEWVDVIILAIDGAWRAGHEPQAIINAVIAKQEHNESRSWPDWRECSSDKAIEHVR